MHLGRFKPDGLAVTLLGLGLLSLIIPMLRVAGLVAVAASLAYSAAVIGLAAIHKRRP